MCWNLENYAMILKLLVDIISLQIHRERNKIIFIWITINICIPKWEPMVDGVIIISGTPCHDMELVKIYLCWNSSLFLLMQFQVVWDYRLLGRQIYSNYFLGLRLPKLVYIPCLLPQRMWYLHFCCILEW